MFLAKVLKAGETCTAEKDLCGNTLRCGRCTKYTKAKCLSSNYYIRFCWPFISSLTIDLQRTLVWHLDHCEVIPVSYIYDLNKCILIMNRRKGVWICWCRKYAKLTYFFMCLHICTYTHIYTYMRSSIQAQKHVERNDCLLLMSINNSNCYQIYIVYMFTSTPFQNIVLHECMSYHVTY